jgi:hypothetical protein
MRSVFIALACTCVIGAVVVGCGGASCDSPHCSADPKPNDATINSCKSIQATKCSDKFNDWANCVDDGTKCDQATKQTDPPTKIAAYNACKPKYDAMQTCCSTYSLTNCPTAR